MGKYQCITHLIHDVDHIVCLTLGTAHADFFPRNVETRLFSTWTCLVYHIDHVIGLAILTAYRFLFSRGIKRRLFPTRTSLVHDVNHVVGLTLRAAYALRFTGCVIYWYFPTRALFVSDVDHLTGLATLTTHPLCFARHVELRYFSTRTFLVHYVYHIVASNSIAATVKDVLARKGLAEYVDLYLSNDDVTHPKPNPEIYVECVKRLGVSPLECVIIEDSFVGKTAANASGCHVLPVRNPDDVILEHMLNYVTYINNGGNTKKLNIVIPMAGLGSRFANVGYKLPKPLIDVNGKPMIQVVVENMNINAHYIFIAMKKHVEEYDIENVVREVTHGNYIIHTIDELTEGSACTVLKVRDIIDNDNPMMLANSDQYLEWDPYEFLVKTQGVDGLISCFEADHHRWSFAKVDDSGRVTEVAEKKVISNLATTGLYYFAKGSQFVRCADSMISKNIRTNGEFYNCPIYNEVILEGGVVKTHMCSKMWGIGVPEDLDYYLQHHKK